MNFTEADFHSLNNLDLYQQTTLPRTFVPGYSDEILDQILMHFRYHERTTNRAVYLRTSNHIPPNHLSTSYSRKSRLKHRRQIPIIQNPLRALSPSFHNFSWTGTNEQPAPRQDISEASSPV